jgi:hypothetical protein
MSPQTSRVRPLPHHSLTKGTMSVPSRAKVNPMLELHSPALKPSLYFQRELALKHIFSPLTPAKSPSPSLVLSSPQDPRIPTSCSCWKEF